MVADFLEILPRCSYRSRPVATKKMIPDVPVQDNDSIKDNYCLKVKDSDIFHKENDLKESEVVTPNEITQLQSKPSSSEIPISVEAPEKAISPRRCHTYNVKMSSAFLIHQCLYKVSTFINHIN